MHKCLFAQLLALFFCLLSINAAHANSALTRFVQKNSVQIKQAQLGRALNSNSFDFKKLAQEESWLRLLHFAGGETEIREQTFFLHKEGKTRADLEMQASLEALQAKAGKADEHFACRYPARTIWLRKNLQLKLPPIACPRYQKWRRTLGAKNITVLFASAYLNSPASAYGHTLLRFGRKKNFKSKVLLDYTVAFGAETRGSGGFAYLWNGLTGGFAGKFSTQPFYLNVHEYSNVESRDFWEYQLKLNDEQVAYLVAHLWELQKATYDYYFLSKNCSYFLLRFLEVANPEWNFADKLPWFTIPVDTIRALIDTGLVREVHHRASRFTKLKARRSQLNSEERELAQAIYENFDQEKVTKLNSLGKTSAAKVLDASYELFRYHTGAANKLTDEQKKFELKFLGERAKLQTKAQQITILHKERPDAAHASTRMSLSAGEFDQREFIELEWKGALHDLLSDPYALEAHSEQSIMHTKIRYQRESKKVLLESLDLLRIRALTPIDPWIWRYNWRAAFGFAQAKDQDCLDWNCSYGFMSGGFGFSASLFDRENFAYILLGIDSEFGAPFENHYRLGAGPELGLKIRFLAFWRILAEAHFKRYLVGAKQTKRLYRLGQSFTWQKNRELRISLSRYNRRDEIQLGIYFYF